jgi:cadmium resistance protein CadD (predicted permease)
LTALPATIAAAAVLFAGTNVDDLIVLSLLNTASRASGRPRRFQIWAGQYAGFGALVAVSLAAGRGLSLVPGRWLWLLALLPLGLGGWQLAQAIRAHRRGEEPPVPTPGGVAGIAALTIVNGADNVAAYTPVFATGTAVEITVTLAVFAAGVAMWCLAGGWLTRHDRITAMAERYGKWILPIAFILIGLYTLHKANAPVRLLSRLCAAPRKASAGARNAKSVPWTGRHQTENGRCGAGWIAADAAHNDRLERHLATGHGGAVGHRLGDIRRAEPGRDAAAT